MRVTVYGAGVIGGILASAIQRSGHDVSVIARGPHLEAMQREGLVVRVGDKIERTRPVAVNSPEGLGAQDLVIVAAKTPSLPEIAPKLPALMNERTLVAFAVNGIYWFYGDGFAPNGRPIDLSRLDPGGALHAATPPQRALGIISVTGGRLREPGVIDASRTDGQFIIGACIPGAGIDGSALVSALSPADIALEWTDDIRVAMWRKYLSVVGNFAMCSLTGATIAEVHGFPATHNILLGLSADAHAVAVAHGFTNLGFDIEQARLTPSKSTHKPSMLQDLERGRAMEIDSAYLALQDLARQAGIATPTLDLVSPLLVLRAQAAGCYPRGEAG